MKLTHYIYISASLALLTSCGEDIEPVYTVGEADNAIVLQAGVADGMQKMQTRGGTRAAGAPTYVAFAKDTKMTLRIDGTWLGHKNADGTVDSNISQYTTGTINAIADSDKDLDTDNDDSKDTRGVTLSPQLYWDDYGTADPKNIDFDNGGKATNGNGGRQKGLTIYGVAVNDASASAPAPTKNGAAGSNWTNLSWTLDQNQSSGWSVKDLLTSNNIKDGADGTYKFDNRNNNTTPGNLLKFTHAMSKVTIVLHAGKGFPNHFEESVDVSLHGFFLSGNVNIESGETNLPDSPSTVNDIKPYKESGTVAETLQSEDIATLTYSALVFPGRSFTSTDEYITISADGNDYIINADALCTKMTEASQNKMLRGYNYLIDVTVNKTEVKVEATIVNWKEIKAENTPLINVSNSYGSTGSDFAKSFDLYRSANILGDYNVNEHHSRVNYSDSKYVLANKLYWPNHSIHYFFRGIWPLVETTAQGDVKNPSYTPDASISTAEGTTCISVYNAPYVANSFPSDLMIGMPRITNSDGTVTSDETCKVNAHKSDEGVSPDGICATEGVIRMNFQYAMSQVIVKLKTNTEEGAKNAVTFDGATEVHIINGYSEGKLRLSDEKSIFSGDAVDFKMNNDNGITNPESNNYANYRNTIIPQTLVDQSNNPTLKFKIVVKDPESDTADNYETVLGISQIPVEVLTGENWIDGGCINAWEPGKIYTYTLTITKTGIKVIATITDWITVKGSTVVVM